MSRKRYRYTTRVALAVWTAFSLVGCASNLTITYHSDPPGAAIYEGSKLIGRAPVEAGYTPTEEFKHGGCMNLTPLTARWVSGAHAQISTLTACAKATMNQQFSFVRPDLPGRDLDVQWAIQLERNAAASEASAQADYWPIIQANQAVYCSSFKTANGMVFTNCRQ